MRLAASIVSLLLSHAPSVANTALGPQEPAPASKAKTVAGMRWQDYEQPGYLRSVRAQYEATELALTNRLQALIADDAPPESQIENYLQRLVAVCALEGKNDTALQYCELALRFGERLKLEPRQQAMLHSTMGKLYGRLGKLTQAELEYSRALSICESDPNAGLDLSKARIGLAEIWVKQARYEKAEKLFQQSLASASEPSPADLVSYANCLFLMGQVEQSEEKLRQALQIDRDQLGEGQPALAADFNDLACVLVKRGKLAEAEANMQEAVRICRTYKYPDLPDWLRNLQYIFKSEGKQEQAAGIEKELSMRPHSLPQ